MKIVERVFDAVTGKTTDTEREPTQFELELFDKTQKEATDLADKQLKVAAAKAALLEKLGITEDEAKLLLS